MRIKITKDGFLKILRNGSFTTNFKEQICPYTTDSDYEQGCGDWCPLFYFEEVYGEEPYEQKIIYYELSLCNGKKYEVDTIEYED